MADEELRQLNENDDRVPISEFTEPVDLDNNDVIPVLHSVNNILTTMKAKLTLLATHLLKVMQFSSDLNTSNKTIIGAINELEEGGGGGGSSTLAGLDDVTITSPVDGQVITYDSQTSKWINGAGAEVKLIDTVSGPVANFKTSLALPLVALKAYIQAQGGGGTPSAPVAVTGVSEVNLTNNPTLQFLDSSTASATSNGITATNLGSGKYRITGRLSTNASATLNFTIPSLVIYGGEDSYFELRNTANMPNTEIIFKNDGTNVERWSFTPANKVSTYSGMRNKTMNGFSIYIPSSYYGQTLDFTIQPVMYGTNSADIHTITLPTTIYGGEVDAVSGEGKNSLKKVKLSELSWTKYGSTQVFYTRVDDKENAKYNYVLSDGFASIHDTASNDGGAVSKLDANYTIIASQGTINPTIYIRVDEASSASDLPSILGDIYCCYELAVHTSFSVTPTQIVAKNGTNNFYADSGDVELSYFNSVAGNVVDLIEVISGSRTDLIATLTAGQTSLTINNAIITTDSTIEIFTDPEVEYNSITVTSGSITITFDAQASDLGVKVRVT